MRYGRLKLSGLFGSEAKNENLIRAIALPKLEIFKCRSSGNRIVGSPIDTTAIYAYASQGNGVSAGGTKHFIEHIIFVFDGGGEGEFFDGGALSGIGSYGEAPN